MSIDFPRPRRPKLALDLAPLIDVVFQLLVFFMLTSTFTNPALSLELPEASGETQQEQPPLVVSVDDAGAIYINQEQVPAGRFKARLGELLQDDPERAVNFRGDQQMRYGRFVELMDEARQVGARQFNIVHQPRE